MAGRYATYTVTFRIPDTGEDVVVKQGDDYDSVTITRLMNFVTFVNDRKREIDANFVAHYNEHENQFEYYVERMFGF
jgi:hypothetical protein